MITHNSLSKYNHDNYKNIHNINRHEARQNFQSLKNRSQYFFDDDPWQYNLRKHSRGRKNFNKNHSSRRGRGRKFFESKSSNKEHISEKEQQNLKSQNKKRHQQKNKRDQKFIQKNELKKELQEQINDTSSKRKYHASTNKHLQNDLIEISESKKNFNESSSKLKDKLPESKDNAIYNFIQKKQSVIQDTEKDAKKDIKKNNEEQLDGNKQEIDNKKLDEIFKQKHKKNLLQQKSISEQENQEKEIEKNERDDHEQIKTELKQDLDINNEHKKKENKGFFRKFFCYFFEDKSENKNKSIEDVIKDQKCEHKKLIEKNRLKKHSENSEERPNRPSHSHHKRLQKRITHSEIFDEKRKNLNHWFDLHK